MGVLGVQVVHLNKEIRYVGFITEFFSAFYEVNELKLTYNELKSCERCKLFEDNKYIATFSQSIHCLKFNFFNCIVSKSDVKEPNFLLLVDDELSNHLNKPLKLV